MNIMFLIFSFNIGGIERLLIDLCNNMVLNGHYVYLCIINNDYTPSLLNELSSKVKVIFLNKYCYTTDDSTTNETFIKKLTFFKFMIKLSKIIRNNKIQILHCQGINCVLFASIAKIINPSIIVLNTVHDCGNYTSYSSLKIFLQNLFCSMTIAISKSVQQEILSRNIPPTKVTLIYNAIDINKFRYITKNKILLSNKDIICIGNVARFYPSKKGQDTLVKAVELLLSKYPSLHCTFAGEIIKSQKHEYDDLISYINKKGMKNHFTFLGNTNNIPSFLNKLDIFVLPSNYEGFGISLIEAMAMGLPCIASRLDGPKEIISDPKLGILFLPGNAIELASSIDTMIQNYSFYNSQEISDNIKARFDIDIAVKKHLALYESLLYKRKH